MADKPILPRKIASLLGKRGGQRVKELYGSEHFSKAGKLGMAKRWAGHVKKSK